MIYYRENNCVNCAGIGIIGSFVGTLDGTNASIFSYRTKGKIEIGKLPENLNNNDFGELSILYIIVF